MRLNVQGNTDVGRVRQHNEDSILINTEIGLAVVADGVGGHAAGEVASKMLVTMLEAESEALSRTLKSMEAGDPVARRRVMRSLPVMVEKASEAIYRHAQVDANCRGMATTLVGMIAAGDHAFIYYVGDSRAYLLRGDDLVQLTEDHSMVNQLLKEGRITPEQAVNHPQKNVILRCVGVNPTVDTDVLFVDLRPNDCFILCSDGMSDMVSDAEIEEFALSYTGAELVQGLIQRANDKGGRDNISVLVAEVEGSEADDARFMAHGVFDMFSRKAILQSMFLFQSLSEQELIKINRCLYERHYADGEMIFRAGDAGTELFVVAHGGCSVERDGVQLTTLGVGSHFGELALLTDEPRSADVRALGATTCFAISRHDLDDVINEDIAVGNRILKGFVANLGNRVRDLSTQLAGHAS